MTGRACWRREQPLKLKSGRLMGTIGLVSAARKCRETDRERAPFAGPAFHIDGPAVALGDPLRQGKPEAGALRLTRSSGIGSIEPLEEMGKGVGRNAHPGIGHGDVSESFRTEDRDRDSSAFWCEFDRVVEQNQKQALQPSGIAVDHHAVCRFARQRNALHGGNRLDLFSNRCTKAHEIDRLVGHLDLAALRSGLREDLIDEASKAIEFINLPHEHLPNVLFR